MKYFKTSKVSIILAAAIILSLIPAGRTFASVQWLSSIPVKVIGPNDTSAPARLAIDTKGNIYVTDRRNKKNRVVVFDREGNLAGAHGGFKSPVGIAVDGNGNIYVGCADTGSVDMYNPDFTFVRKLGTGDREFQFPSSIASASDGRIYVVDTKANTIKVYNQNGTTAFSFGSYGTGDGKFNEPYGISIDEAAGEIYITDRSLVTITDPTYGTQTVGGARVQVFTMNGGFKGSFGEFGSGQGQMKMPIGIAADGAGKLYVTDANTASVHIFTTAGEWLETVSDSAHLLKTPIGIVIGRDKRMFVASSNGGTIEVYGLDGYTAMAVSAGTLSFSAVEGQANPAVQTVTVSNGGTGDLAWTAAAENEGSVKWLAATPGGTAGPGASSELAVSVNAATLVAGSYSGTVTVTAPGGEEKISITLAVSAPPAILSVTPGSLHFTAQQNGPVPATQTFTVSNTGGGNMSWTEPDDSTMLEFNKIDSRLLVGMKSTALAPGNYSETVSIAAQGAQGSPAALGVTVEIVEAGTVKVSSNIDGAAFKITGPETHEGSGKAWTKEMVKPGDYTVTFGHVSGYLKPATRKFSITTGQVTALSGDYRAKAVPTHVIAGSMDPATEINVSIQPLAGGKMPRFLTAFTGADSIRVASGDIDGSGLDKMVVTDYKRTVKVFSDQAADPLASFELPQNYRHADAVVGDIDNDGRADILVGAEDQKEGRTIKVFSYAAASLKEESTLLEEKGGAFSMALGDVNGDGIRDLILADANSVRAFEVRQGVLTQLWIKNGDYGVAPQVAAGDLNNDGISEIAVSYDRAKETKGRNRSKESASLISIMKGTGEDAGLTIEPFKDLGYAKASTVAMGDIDGDGADELVAGAGPSDDNEPMLRIFESDGTYAGITMKPLNGKNGVNVGLGSFQ